MKEDFKFQSYPGLDDFLIVESNRLTETVKFINDNKIKNILINWFLGYELKDINFVEDCKGVESIQVIQGFINLKGIETLTNLKFLLLNDELLFELDLNNYPELEFCSLLWNNKIKNLNKCKKMKSLCLRKLKMKSKDLEYLLSNLNNLENLELNQSSITNLSFLTKLKHIKKLELYYLLNLNNIEGLIQVKNTLTKLVINHSKKILDFTPINSLMKLESLHITDLGQIESLHFINGLKDLKHFSFVGTNIKDGDLSLCKGINYVAFDNKRHYSATFEEMNQNRVK